MRSSLRRALVVVVAGALGLVACAPGATNNNSSNSTSTDLHGKSVSIIGTWSGAELDSFNAVLQPWESQTGATVQFEGTRDINAILTTRVAAGNPPDLAAAPSPTLLTRFANEGKVKPLNSVLDMTKLQSEYAKSWLDLGTINGKLYETFSWAALKGLVWYNPKVFSAKGYTVPKTWSDLMTLQQKIKADGTTPWCMAVESGSASGWAGSDFQKEIALSTMGPNAYDQWWQGKLKWSSPDSKTAWTTFGQVLGPNDANVYGGANYIINTNFGNVGDPMFQTPPKCTMLNQASFITDFFVKANPSLKAGTDFNFFPLPDVSTKYAGSHVVAADSWAMFNDTPAAKSLMQYLVTAPAQAIWVKRGGKLSPNNKTNLADYPDDLTRQIAQLLTATKIARYDAGDLMPADMQAAYWSGILDFIKDPTKLDSILANLDKVQATAYTA
jgi:alpha-glucoside transport system substrate-binding protein